PSYDGRGERELGATGLRGRLVATDRLNLTWVMPAQGFDAIRQPPPPTARHSTPKRTEATTDERPGPVPSLGTARVRDGRARRPRADARGRATTAERPGAALRYERALWRSLARDRARGRPAAPSRGVDRGSSRRRAGRARSARRGREARPARSPRPAGPSGDPDALRSPRRDHPRNGVRRAARGGRTRLRPRRDRSRPGHPARERQSPRV